MENQNLENNTLDNKDNVESQAVNEQLLAGKFKSKDALIESTANLIKQVEGRDMTPTEVLKLVDKPNEELESVYKGLERQFHTNRPASKEVDNGQGEIEEAYKVLDQWASERGYVRKEELNAQKYEEEELGTYLKQNPSAESRVELIKTLSVTDGFKDKSFADIDKFITSQIPQAEKEALRTEKMGNSMEEKDDWSPESVREALQNSKGARLYR